MSLLRRVITLSDYPAADPAFKVSFITLAQVTERRGAGHLRPCEEMVVLPSSVHSANTPD